MKSIRLQWRRPSISSFCTTSWSCTRPVVGRGRKKQNRAAKSGVRRRRCIGKRAPATRELVRGDRVFVAAVAISTPCNRETIRIVFPRKAVQAATRMAIRSKLDSGNLICVDQLSFSEPRTKEMAAVLGALKLSGYSTLVATAGYDVNVYKSARNIEKVTVSPVAELNALSVLQPRRMLVTKEALDAICRKVQA